MKKWVLFLSILCASGLTLVSIEASTRLWTSAEGHSNNPYNPWPLMVRLISLVACPTLRQKSTLTCSTTRSPRSASFSLAIGLSSLP
jgi:hypothetical protein